MAVITPFLTVSPKVILAGETVVLTWGGSDPGSTYYVQRSSNNGSSWGAVLSNTSLTTHSLAINVNTLFRVRAYKNGEYSSYSTIESVTVAVPLTVPVVTVSPTSLPGGGLATISWTDSGVGADYDIQKSVDNGVTWTNIATGYTSLSITDNVTKTTQYRVRAHRNVTYTDYSIPKEVVYIDLPTTPSVLIPASITVSTAFNVSWSGGNGGTFYVERSINGGTYTVLLSNTTATSKSETPTSSWTSVRYRVRAYLNGYYSDYGYSNTINIRAQTPTVTIPSKIMQRNDFTVSWSSATTGSVYTVERSINGGTYTAILTSTSSTSKVETPLDTWTSVRYRVTANHGGANSVLGYSSTVTVDPFFPKLKVMQGGGVKTGIAGWVLVGGVLKRVKDIWIMTGGVLKKLS